MEEPIRYLSRAEIDQMTDDEYEAYCAARVDAAYRQYKETGITYTMDEIFASIHEEAKRIERARRIQAGGGAACSL